MFRSICKPISGFIGLYTFTKTRTISEPQGNISSDICNKSNLLKINPEFWSIVQCTSQVIGLCEVCQQFFIWSTGNEWHILHTVYASVCSGSFISFISSENVGTVPLHLRSARLTHTGHIQRIAGLFDKAIL